MEIPSILVPPLYCHYAEGPCDQEFDSPTAKPKVFFAYPAAPDPIAYTIESAASKLRRCGTISRVDHLAGSFDERTSHLLHYL